MKMSTKMTLMTRSLRTRRVIRPPRNRIPSPCPLIIFKLKTLSLQRLPPESELTSPSQPRDSTISTSVRTKKKKMGLKKRTSTEMTDSKKKKQVSAKTSTKRVALRSLNKAILQTRLLLEEVCCLFVILPGMQTTSLKLGRMLLQAKSSALIQILTPLRSV